MTFEQWFEENMKGRPFGSDAGEVVTKVLMKQVWEAAIRSQDKAFLVYEAVDAYDNEVIRSIHLTEDGAQEFYNSDKGRRYRISEKALRP